MRISRLTYPLIAIAIVPVALVSLKKINKVSFFDHFFKVIEEVELRNSHEVDAFPVHLWYEERTQREDKPSFLLSDFTFLFEAYLSNLSLIQIGDGGTNIWEKAISASDIFHLFSPNRAP